jgi:hypothetical protein
MPKLLGEYTYVTKYYHLLPFILYDRAHLSVCIIFGSWQVSIEVF